MSDLIANQLKSIQFEYEHIQIDRVKQLVEHYDINATFKDPFQEVHGRDAIIHIFEKMFTQLNNPSFKVISAMPQGLEASLLWEFKFGFKRWDQSPQSLKGVSWLKFNEAGLITSHIDYWDPAEGIYEKLPLIGSLMRFLKKQA
jgi:steroid delta-isomerase